MIGRRRERVVILQWIGAGLAAYGLYTLAGEVLSGLVHTLFGLIVGSAAVYFPMFWAEWGPTIKGE